MALSYKFLKEVPLKVGIKCKKGMYFSFDFVWYSIHLDIVHYEQGVGRFHNRQNLLSMTEAICQQSFHSRDIQICVHSSSPLFFSVSHCFRG